MVALNNNAENKMTRHEARFGITSFIYRSRRPFHPGRLGDVLLEPFFSKMQIEDDDEEDKVSEEERQLWLQKLQDEADLKKVARTDAMGQLLRSKGKLRLPD